MAIQVSENQKCEVVIQRFLDGISGLRSRSGLPKGGMNTSEDNAKKKPSRKAISSIRKIVFIYASCSCLWILFSDKAVGWLISDPATVTLVSTVKGWIFVAVTSLLIYGLLRRLIDQLQAASQREQVVQEENARIHQLLNAIVDNSGDAIFAKDLHGRYLLFNVSVQRRRIARRGIKRRTLRGAGVRRSGCTARTGVFRAYP